ncbi:MAG: hypothetical protein O9301_15390 [Leptospira sp.]|nr:hypothetical protein [Leptospira sp.]
MKKKKLDLNQIVNARFVDIFNKVFVKVSTLCEDKFRVLFERERLIEKMLLCLILCINQLTAKLKFFPSKNIFLTTKMLDGLKTPA